MEQAARDYKSFLRREPRVDALKSRDREISVSSVFDVTGRAPRREIKDATAVPRLEPRHKDATERARKLRFRCAMRKREHPAPPLPEFGDLAEDWQASRPEWHGGVGTSKARARPSVSRPGR